MKWDDDFMNQRAFMDFIGYRHMNVEDIIKDCLERVKQGERFLEIPAEGLTQGEMEYIENEVRRRLQDGEF